MRKRACLSREHLIREGKLKWYPHALVGRESKVSQGLPRKIRVWREEQRSHPNSWSWEPCNPNWRGKLKLGESRNCEEDFFVFRTMCACSELSMSKIFCFKAWRAFLMQNHVILTFRGIVESAVFPTPNDQLRYFFYFSSPRRSLGACQRGMKVLSSARAEYSFSWPPSIHAWQLLWFRMIIGCDLVRVPKV